MIPWLDAERMVALEFKPQFRAVPILPERLLALIAIAEAAQECGYRSEDDVERVRKAVEAAGRVE